MWVPGNRGEVSVPGGYSPGGRCPSRGGPRGTPVGAGQGGARSAMRCACKHFRYLWPNSLPASTAAAGSHASAAGLLLCWCSLVQRSGMHTYQRPQAAAPCSRRRRRGAPLAHKGQQLAEGVVVAKHCGRRMGMVVGAGRNEVVGWLLGGVITGSSDGQTTQQSPSRPTSLLPARWSHISSSSMQTAGWPASCFPRTNNKAGLPSTSSTTSTAAKFEKRKDSSQPVVCHLRRPEGVAGRTLRTAAPAWQSKRGGQAILFVYSL